jgi:c-di-GMP-related signal transduction protein
MDLFVARQPIFNRVRAAFLGERNALGHLLAVAICQERADWVGLQQHATASGLAPSVIPACYLEAVQWATAVYGSQHAPAGTDTSA